MFFYTNKHQKLLVLEGHASAGQDLRTIPRCIAIPNASRYFCHQALVLVACKAYYKWLMMTSWKFLSQASFAFITPIGDGVFDRFLATLRESGWTEWPWNFQGRCGLWSDHMGRSPDYIFGQFCATRGRFVVLSHHSLIIMKIIHETADKIARLTGTLGT